MKTIKKVKIGLAVTCAIIAISLCIAVCNEWKAQGCEMPFSLFAGCAVYIAGCVGLYVGLLNFAEWIDYWFFNGDDNSYKGRKH